MRLEKQVDKLRTELAALKSHVTEETTKGRARQDIMLARILGKVGSKPRSAKKR